MVEFALELDTPYSFAIENGFARTQRSTDFRILPGGELGTWLDPVSGVLMLYPSFLDNTFTGGLRPLSDFTTTATEGQWWAQVARGGEDGGVLAAAMLASLRPTGVDPTGLTLTSVAQALITIASSPTLQDTLVWAASGNFQIPRDGSFTIHYDTLNDEVMRHHNWFAVQWANVYCLFGMDGICSVYRYNDSSMQTYTQIDRFQYADTGEVMYRHAQFSFVPIPTVGLLIYHSYTERAPKTASSSAQSRALRGHVVPWQAGTDGSGNFYMFDASSINIAFNPYFRHVIGYQDVSFATSGGFVDAPFDPGYKPSVGPSAVQAITAQTGVGSVMAALYDPDGVTPWTAGSSQQGRVGMILSGTSTNTPFVLGYGVAIPPVMNTRNPGAVTIYNTTGRGQEDRLLHLNWEDTDDGRFDGQVTMQLYSAAAMKIAWRGDATWSLSADGVVFAGGFTVRGSWDIEPMEGTPGYYKVTVKLADMHARLKEGHYFIENALDGVTLAAAFNNVLSCTGFGNAGSLPPQAYTQEIPITSDGRSWKWQFREGDDADALFEILLFLMRRQQVEYVAAFDWADTGTWQVTTRPGSLGTTWAVWYLSPFSEDANTVGNVWWYGPGTKFTPESAEGNIVIAEGVLDPGPDGTRVPTVPLINLPSINDPTSPDYLGRALEIKYAVDNVEDIPTLQTIQRAIFDAATTRRLKGQIKIEMLQMALAPNTQVMVTDWNGSVIANAWIKKRHVVVNDPYGATMDLDVDTVWQGEVPR